MGRVSTARAPVTWAGMAPTALGLIPAPAIAVVTECVGSVIARAIPSGLARIAATCLTVLDSCRNLA